MSVTYGGRYPAEIAFGRKRPDIPPTEGMDQGQPCGDVEGGQDGSNDSSNVGTKRTPGGTALY
eukprot:12924899-Prorocentrum_lima.AAC.1